MLVFRAPEEVPASFGPTAVSIGNFDGVHAGHREIMRRLVARARAEGLTPAVLTFDPHPARILAPERAPKLIMTVAQRLRAMESEGVEAVLLLPFSPEFASLSPAAFARGILGDRLHARCILVGEDFRFGHKQAGSIETLREWFDVKPVAPVMRRAGRISSSAIRGLLAAGEVSRACRMLGGAFALEGAVVKGQGIGSKQTVPTLNLAPENEVLPKTGVYVTRTRDLASSRTWPSITNIGYRPTFHGEDITVETFLLQALEGETPARIEVKFLKFVRDERRFEDSAALRAQILKDAAFAARLHRRLSSRDYNET